LAGLAGATKVIVFHIATLTDVGFGISGEAVLMTVLGGIQTMAGPVVGAALLVTIQNYLAGWAEWVVILQGVVFVVVVLLFRHGIVGEIADWYKSRKLRAAAVAVAQAR
jgi:branched-chain amino acid transport system permease protein